jgi:iron complex outermembrane recepter protein
MRIFAWTLLLVFIPFGLLWAQDDSAQDFYPARLLDEESDRLADKTGTVREYRGEELEGLGIRDLSGVMQMISGGYLVTGGKFPKRQESYLHLRGQDAVRVRVLLDGVPMNDGYFETADFSRFPVSRIAVVRVVTGPSGNRYGFGDIGGTVEILTRHVNEEMSADFKADWGAGDALGYSMWMGDTQEWFNFFAAADHDERRTSTVSGSYDVVPGEDGGERQNSDSNRNAFHGRMGLVFGLPFKVFAGGSYDQGEKSIPRELVSQEKGYDRLGLERRATGQLNLLSKPSGYFELRGAGYVTENSRRTDRFTSLDYAHLFSQSYQKDLLIGGRLLPTIDFGRYSRIRLGGEVNRDEVEAWFQDRGRSRFVTSSYRASLEDDFYPAKFLGISLGAAYESMKRELTDLGEGETVAEAAPYLNGNPHSDFNAVAPRVGMLLAPYSTIEFHVAASRKPRFPSLYELYDNELGNLDLNPEQALMGEFGYRQSYQSYVSWDLVGFYTQVDETIRFLHNSARKEERRYDNAGKLNNLGGTVLVEARPVPGLFARADYTYLRSRFAPDQDSPNWRKKEFFAPQHRADFLAGYRFDFGLGAYAGALFASEQSDIDSHSEAGDLPYYSLAHARVYYNYRENLELYVAGENILDVYYETTRRYPMPGRSIHGGIELKF